MGLKVGDIRVRKSDMKNPFKIVFIGESRAFCRYLKKPDHYYEEFADCLSYIRDYTVPYQEPKPVRKLVAYRYRETGEIRMYDQKQLGLYKFDELSDEELKELFSFMKD